MHPGIYSGCKYTRATSDACVLRIGTVLGQRLMTFHESTSTRARTSTRIETEASIGEDRLLLLRWWPGLVNAK